MGRAQDAMRPLLSIPDELSILDIFCFGPPKKPVYKRWKKDAAQIINWDRFDPDNFISDEDLDTWIRKIRHKVMYKDAKNID